MNKKLLGYLFILFACTLFVRAAIYFVPQIETVSQNINLGRFEIVLILSMVYMMALLLGFMGMLIFIRYYQWPDFQTVTADNGHVLDHLSAIPTILGLPYLGSALWSSKRIKSPPETRLAFTKALDFHFSMTLYLIPSLLMINFGIGAILLMFIICYWLFFITLNTIRVAMGKSPYYTGGFAIINRIPKAKKQVQ